MEFRELEELKREINVLLAQNIVSLKHYHLDNFCGFRHIYNPDEVKDYFSKSSTATCVLSLMSTGHWTENQPWWYKRTELLITELLKPKNWESAGLPEGNPFTVAFILEAILALSETDKLDLLSEPEVKQRISEAVQKLRKSLTEIDKDDPYSEKGAASILPYPPSTYLTQLVVRVLKRANKLSGNIQNYVYKWAWRQIEHELSLIYSKSKNNDPLSLAYAIILIASCSETSDITPDDNWILKCAFENFFDKQLPDGTWPRSRPLFHYPEVGDAYCFEYEALTQLLHEKRLKNLAINHLTNFKLAVDFLKQSAFHFEGGGLGWASGHHPQLPGPESWSTAAVYHFLYELDRLLAEAIRNSTFSYIGAEYISPLRLREEPHSFAPKYLDSQVNNGIISISLKKVVYEGFVRQVFDHSKEIEQGRPLPDNIPISAILFGPPGTAKTTLAREIAGYLGWPLLSIDPSHLVRKGMDKIQAETNAMFSMLAAAESIVVLLDEFDELVRERKSDQSEVMSRFLTTAMLPKLSRINERRRIVFLVNTNHIDQFDFAIRRPGRFDLILQVMPPTAEQKMMRWPSVKKKLDEMKIEYGPNSEVEKQLGGLIFQEFADFANKLEMSKNTSQAIRLIQDTYKNCTINQKVYGQNDDTWASICEQQRGYIRLPPNMA